MALTTLRDLDPIEEPEETGATFEDNARLKALYYASRSGMMTVAEDSGLVIDGMDGEPGVRSARFLRPDASYPERFAEIFRRLAEQPVTNRAARFVCALAVAEDARIVYEARGHRGGRDRARAARRTRVRIRPDLLLPSLRRDARRGHGRGRSSPSPTAVRRSARSPPGCNNAELPNSDQVCTSHWRLSTSAKRSSARRVLVSARTSDFARLDDHRSVESAARTSATSRADPRIASGMCTSTVPLAPWLPYGRACRFWYRSLSACGRWWRSCVP